MTDNEQQILDKLERHEILNKHELEIVREMIKYYDALQVWGKFAGMIRNVVIWFAAMFAAYYAVNEWIIQSIKGAVK